MDALEQMTEPPRKSSEAHPLAASEAELSRRTADGDMAAAARLAELTYRRVFSAQLKFTGGDVDLAADLTQETYRKAWTSIHRFSGRSRFSTWLYRIAYNVFLTHVSRPRRLSPIDEEQVEAVPDPGPSQDQTLSAARVSARLRRAVLALPDDLRFAITARYWGDVPVREIAAHEGLSPVGIRKRLLRAYARLAEDLGSSEDIRP